MPRPATRSSTRQQAPTLTEYFPQSRVDSSALPGKSIGDVTTPRAIRAKRETTKDIASSKDYGSSLMNEEVKKAGSVPLPTSYSELYKTFNACETIVCLFDSSGRTLTLATLSQEVKKTTRKEFSFDRFSQLLAVYPQAYNVQVKKISCVGDRMGGVRAPRWEHVIKPNLDDDLKSFVKDPLLLEETHQTESVRISARSKKLLSPVKGPASTSSTEVTVIDSCKRLKGWRISCRQQVFRFLLTRRVTTAYDGFVKERKLSPTVTSPSAPSAFDRDFVAEMDSLCVLIEKATLEQIPEDENTASTSHKGMGEFLKIASDTVAAIPKEVEEALNNLRSPVKKSFSAREVPPPSPTKPAEKPKPLSVLERIKARNALKAAAELKRNPELEKKLADLVRLLNDRILFLIFDIYRASSKTSFKLNEMEERVVASGKISRDKMPSLLPRLVSLVPSHFSISKTSIGEYIKVTDNSPSASEIVELALKKELEACNKEMVAHSSCAMRAIG